MRLTVYKNSALMVLYCCPRVRASGILSEIENYILSERQSVGLYELFVNKSVLVRHDLVIFVRGSEWCYRS